MIIKQFLGFCILFCFIQSAKAGITYNLLEFKAHGDGISDDTNALLDAWRTACADASSPRLLIPSRMNFLINKITLQGTCRSDIHVQIDGSITAPNKMWTNEKTSWLLFDNIDNLEIGGTGILDGQGVLWWQCIQCNKPVLLAIDACTNVVVRDVHFMNSPSKHLTLNKCNNVLVDRISITAPGDSPNTDGIIMMKTQNVLITRSIIGTGDDCVAILTDSSDINITRCTCGPSHGISIGSLGGHNTEARVERIFVSHNLIYNSMTGVRIKTWEGGYGYARDITFEHIKMYQVKTPINIDQSYMDHSIQENAMAIKNVKFVNIYGTSTRKEAIKIQCSPTSPCKDLTFNNISLYYENPNMTLAICENAYGMAIGRIVPSLGRLG